MKIGEFAKRSSISVRMLRFYESAGILVPARTPSGYREYREQEIGFVRKVVLLNRAGLALKDIALMRDCLNDEPQNFCPALRGKLADTLVHRQPNRKPAPIGTAAGRFAGSGGKNIVD